MQKSEFRLWDDCVIFKNGMYYYLDGKGGASLISKECAKKIEADYYDYHARMDVNRGGEDPERAYPSRGFSKDADGNWKYTSSYEVEALAGNKRISPIEGDFSIPESLSGGQEINQIRREAFLGCNLLSKITIPETVQVIEENAFSDTVFYKTEENWTEDALYMSGWLIKVREQAKGVFEVSDGTKGIANGAFRNCDKLTEINIPDSVKCIGSFVFKDCEELLNIRFPEKVSCFGDRVLSGCPNLTHVQIPGGVTKIGAYAFAKCENLTDIELPDSVKYIGVSAFEYCSKLTEIRIPDKVERVRCSLFRECDSLTKVHFGVNVKVMEKWVFYRNKNLESLIIENPDLEIADAAICNCPKLTIYAPEGSTAQKYALWNDIAFSRISN